MFSVEAKHSLENNLRIMTWKFLSITCTGRIMLMPCIDMKNHLTVMVRKCLMFDEVHAIWLKLNEGDKGCCLISCIYINGLWILQTTRETSDTSTSLEIILVFQPGLHKSGVVIKWNFNDYYLVYAAFEFNLINQKMSTYNVVKFMDIKRLHHETLINDLNSCEVLNGSL